MYTVLAIASCRLPDGADALDLPLGYPAATAIAVIGLYIAFILPIILRLRPGDRFERGAWHLGTPLQVDRRDRDPLGRVHLLVFMLPLVLTGVPWNTGFTGSSSTTR